MDVLLRRAEPVSRPAGLLAVGVPEGPIAAGSPAARVDRAGRGAVKALLASGDFTGRAGQTALLWLPGVKPKRVLLVGLGRARDLDEARVMLAAAAASRRARDLSAGTLTLAFGEAALNPRRMRAMGEGVVLGHHRHTAYLTSGGRPALERVEVLVGKAPSPTLQRALAAGVTRGEAVGLARDLASTPGQDLPPATLAERAVEIAHRVGARATVHDVAAMERLGMGCTLAVGRGSPHAPCFVELVKDPARKRRGAVPTVVLIGKGVTFDTGGVSLKPREQMNKMKYDMSGSAAVIGVFASLATLDLPFRLVGLIPSAENVTGSKALKPGDVIRAMDGTTIEVTNTDAEGRLLLADALVYARRFKPRAIVDLATLTGAMSIALGRHAAGLFSPDDALAAEIHAAGERTGERLWRMPLWPEFLTEMRGDTADLVNSNERREGGSNTAAAFLWHFAKGQPWVHLDIASTAWTYGERADSSKGPNAFGVRLLVDWLEQRAAR